MTLNGRWQNLASEGMSHICTPSPTTRVLSCGSQMSDLLILSLIAGFVIVCLLQMMASQDHTIKEQQETINHLKGYIEKRDEGEWR